MSMKTKYNTIWDYLYNLFKNDANLNATIKTFTKAFVTRPPDYPLLSVLPWIDKFEWRDISSHQPTFGFEILIVTSQPSPTQSLAEANDLSWDVYNLLISDLDLGGNLLQPLEVVEREQFQDLNERTAGVILRIRCKPK